MLDISQQYMSVKMQIDFKNELCGEICKTLNGTVVLCRIATTLKSHQYF